MQGKGQVALARAEIDGVQWLLLVQCGAAQCVGKHLDELIDLLPFARHGWHQFMLGVGHSKVAEEWSGQF